MNFFIKINMQKDFTQRHKGREEHKEESGGVLYVILS
jgi:hypothetical protein